MKLRGDGGNRRTFDVTPLDARVHKIMDLNVRIQNDEAQPLREHFLLTSRDEVKFVIASRADYEWAREKLPI